MKERAIKLSVVISLALLACGGGAQGSILLTENFDGGSMPVGWSSTLVAGSFNWVVRDASTLTFPTPTAHSGTSVAWYDSWDAVSGSSARLATSVVDLTGYSSASLSFFMHHDPGFSGQADRVIAQVYNGSTWSDLGGAVNRYQASSAHWDQETFSLPGSVLGNSNVRVGFLAISEFGNNTYLDDVVLTAEAGGAVPEPATLTLVALGLAPLLLRRRRG
jgi:hypothetical protein